ncbi:12621_t:CDS:1 [Funneliformis geosporum]|uniref:18808_t:CDS:1 n=1 Tax=Funneliformis geosporum TaxID=1117311 RepID=A0A9W4SKC0_9GLOM|nr:18808_t:CDS:1 [Funneliformis geosporum]CAI2172057.1 12621_t:CDS:1 [Funneliformis geosporum]
MPVANLTSTKSQREHNEPIKQEKEINNTQTEVQNTITPMVPLFTLWDYLKDELTASDFDTLQELKRERVTNFLGIPWSIEKLMTFGFFICLDSFLYTVTILPLRVIFAFYSLIMNIISFFNNDRYHERKHDEILNLSQKCDLLKGLLIILVCLTLQNVEASQIYHIIRGQSAIKLYVIFNVLEILDRLCCSFGGDILDSLFSRSTLGKKKEDSKIHPNWRPINFFILAFLYILVHSIILFYQAITLNVAINSYSNALLTLLLSNQFIEIKGSVFKRFEKENLFQLSCADIVERFQLVIFLSVITARNLIELSGSPPSPFSILPASFIPLFPAMTTVETLMTPVLFVLLSELLVDWLKHAFITKFNHIRTSVYDRYIDMLSRDLVIGNPTRNPNHNEMNNHVKSQKFVDQSPIVSRRIGFAALPLTCFTISVTLQTVTMIYDWVHEMEDNPNNMPISNVATQPPIVWILCGTLLYIMLILLKLLVGINLLGFAHRRYASMEMREDEEKAQTKKLEEHVVAEKEEREAKSRILNNSNDNLQKPEITLDNIDRYTLFKSRIP